MTSNQRKAIVSPAAGLVVFDTDHRQLFLFDSGQWLPLNTGSGSNDLIPVQQSLAAADQKSSGYFGIDVDISGNYAVVGEPQADSGLTISTGAVHVFTKSPTGGWNITAKLYASDPQTNSFYGGSVSIAGKYLVVGAPRKTVSGIINAGKIYIYIKGEGETWTLQTSFERPRGCIC